MAKFRLVDGVWTDIDIKNPLAKMTELLNKTTNRSLVKQWGIWIVVKDPDLGLKVCDSCILCITFRELMRPPAADFSRLEKVFERGRPCSAVTDSAVQCEGGR